MNAMNYGAGDGVDLAMIEGGISLSACSSGVPTDLQSALNVGVGWGGGVPSLPPLGPAPGR